ncbi:MAG: tetratricopeptide repeat protein [Candidatus Marinimicrobia bacterium]|nr:tetratricopeptide repeat protein [Candidatus Neomarinimicrobiota bacterium]
MRRIEKILLLLTITTVMSCAYYNTFYNARLYYEMGIKDYRESLTKTNATYTKKNFDIAIEKSERILAKYPDSKYIDDAQFIIAVSNYYKENYRKAKKEIETFFNLYPDSELKTEMDMWYGRVFWKMGNPEMAIHHWKQMAPEVKDNELKSEMFYSIGEVFEELNKSDSAIYYYDKTTKVRGGSEKHGLAQYHIAELYLKLGDMDKAIDNIEKVGQFNISDELKQKRQLLLLKTYRQAGEYKKAEKTIYKKLNDEKNKDFWDQLELELALIFKDQGDTASAMSRFKSIVDNKTYAKSIASASAYYHIGMMFLMDFHRYDAAAKNFGLVKGENKNCEYVFDAEQRVQQLKRFEKINASLLITKPVVREILTNLNSPQEIEIDTVALDTTLKTQEEIKQELEADQAEKVTKPVQIDTLKTFEQYYNALYEMAELYYFDFNFQDSAKYYLREIAASQYFNPFVEQSLYALYYISDLEKDINLANFYKETLQEKNPDSPYLSFLETGKVQLPETNETEKLTFQKAESYIPDKPDSAIILFKQLAEYENPYQGKSVANIAWLMENEKYDLQNSIRWYQVVADSFPNEEAAVLAKEKLQILNALATSLQKPPEEKPAKDEVLPATVPSDTISAIGTPAELPDSTNQQKAIENIPDSIQIEKVKEAGNDAVQNKGNSEENEKTMPVKNIKK